MKKSLLIALVFGMSFFISAMAFAAANHGDIEDCDALEGEAYELCESYCYAKACATDDPNGNPKSCARIKDNFMKKTGTDILPCDIVACATCGDPDPDDLLNTIGECEEMKAIDCVEPYVSAGEVSCDVVSIPAALDPNNTAGVGCDNISPDNMLGIVFNPDCQNGMPGFVCSLFLGGTPLPAGEGCPAPPSCFE